jgi:hypothetical protein
VKTAHQLEVQVKDAHVSSKEVLGSNPPCFNGRQSQKIIVDLSRKLTLLVNRPKI